jgi:cytochrome c oxidase subunit 2
MRHVRRAWISVPLLLLTACQHYQSMFGNAGIENRQFQILFWIFVAVCGAMYLLVIAFLLAGIMRRRRAEADAVEARMHHQTRPLMRTGLIVWSALIATGLAALAIASFVADRTLANAAAHERLSITVTANQWWWDVQYNASDPTKIARTANELHLPVGVPARITLRSRDVIHSLWLPSLAGKRDLIPGRINELTIIPSKIGIYRGQCAEFCGTQHAHMALVVSVDSHADFLKWWEHQLQPAQAPRVALEQAGYAYVTQRRCAECHTISGTSAHGRIGPDLTHLAIRRSIAAGTMPMGEGNLYGWVANPQAIKPGTKMPALGLEPDELHAVVAYLETLK